MGDFAMMNLQNELKKSLPKLIVYDDKNSLRSAMIPMKACFVSQ